MNSVSFMLVSRGLGWTLGTSTSLEARRNGPMTTSMLVRLLFLMRRLMISSLLKFYFRTGASPGPTARIPILVKLDRVLVNAIWNVEFPNSSVTSKSAAVSDHCQVLLTAATTIPRSNISDSTTTGLALLGSLTVSNLLG
jgi:hypothetical protein